MNIGELVQDELDERGWTVDDLAAKSLIGATRLREVIAGKSRITMTVALGLSNAFGTSMEFWVNLQKQNTDKQ